MNDFSNIHLHPIENAGALDSRLRLLLQNPRRILKKYVRPGMTVLDLGCGTGYFTLEMAKLLNGKGKVIAIDVQEGMLEILKRKLRNSELQKLIEIHNSEENEICLTEKVDFIFAFYSFHEMKYIDHIIRDLTRIVKPETMIYISEQKFHVSKNKFNKIIEKMETRGFEICERPEIFFSRTVIMKIRQ
ncbi:class I SAM-dependent methyltransferase [Prolixibacter sp. NT017]|uniref:class I SAM-dependent methyltransferase n=1 Tax=Prolixibacter sp. NT017 TaxID=2652390 RepID=UPI00126F24D0|nr:class I SAM-dependent methyltransferase [Prolixibacter sp. NT017]GET24063.1 type 11 methyltransferase [Prolixibacter sp. NT017]